MASGDGVMDHADLAPGENVQGLVVFTGNWTPAKVEFKGAGYGTLYSAPVK